jgi:hypothetical protein
MCESLLSFEVIDCGLRLVSVVWVVFHCRGETVSRATAGTTKGMG